MSGTVFISTPGAAVPGVNWTNGLDGTIFAGANLSGAHFERQNATTANFTDANLANALIAGSIFTGNRSADLSLANYAYASPISGANSSLSVALEALSEMRSNSEGVSDRYPQGSSDKAFNK